MADGAARRVEEAGVSNPRRGGIAALKSWDGARRLAVAKAFSSEVDTDSRKENASKQESRAFSTFCESRGFPSARE
jgi:hypothetical protein